MAGQPVIRLTPKGMKQALDAGDTEIFHAIRKDDPPELIKLRDKMARGSLQEGTKEYKAAVKKWGQRLSGHMIRHRANTRFAVGKETKSGPARPGDTKVSKRRWNPLTGYYMDTRYYDKDGYEVLDTPILPAPGKARRDKIDELYTTFKHGSIFNYLLLF